MRKKTFTDYAEAMTIFAKYAPDATWVLHPEHDQLSASCDFDAVTDEADRARLEELGWFESSEDSGWMIFT